MSGGALIRTSRRGGRFGAWALSGLALVGSAAWADAAVLPLHASHCVEALTDGRVLMTNAMIGTTAEAVGLKDADPRARIFVVPHEKLVFSMLDLGPARACLVTPMAETDPWSRGVLKDVLVAQGLVEAPECAQADTTLWFSTKANETGHAVTVAVTGDATDVTQIMAFETLRVSDPKECADAG